MMELKMRPHQFGKKVRLEYHEMFKRATNLRGAIPEIRRILSTSHEKYYKRKPVGDMESGGLGRAIIDRPLVEFEGKTLIFGPPGGGGSGTEFFYSRFNDAWRREQKNPKLGPLLRVTGKTQRLIAEAIARWIAVAEPRVHASIPAADAE